MLKTYKHRIYPNNFQIEQINKTFGCVRLVYNNVLAYKKEIYEKEHKEMKNILQKFNLINGILQGNELGDIRLLSNDILENIVQLYVGEDFLIGLDINGNIVFKYILQRDEHFKLKALEEIQALEQYIYEKQEEIGEKTL